MDLVLWRHAEAESGEPDEGRKLTAKGEKQARRIAEWLHNRLPDSARILSSPAKRAQQTAQALAEASHRKIRTVEALAPAATVDEILDAVGWTAGKGTLVLVGHQPTLGRLVSRLLSGAERDWPIRKGAVVWISQRGSNGDAEPMLRAAVGPEFA